MLCALELQYSWLELLRTEVGHLQHVRLAPPCHLCDDEHVGMFGHARQGCRAIVQDKHQTLNSYFYVFLYLRSSVWRDFLPLDICVTFGLPGKV
jgi:hypothetical protein